MRTSRKSRDYNTQLCTVSRLGEVEWTSAVAKRPGYLSWNPIDSAPHQLGTMAALRVAVHVALPIPVQKTDGSGPAGVWSPISCTLIYSESEAVLVDTPITIQQNRLLINWIEETAPNRKISYIYITHGHPDHWLGISQLLQRWPEAVPLATPGTIAHMQQSVEPGTFERSWGAFFPGQIYQPFTFAQPLGPDKAFLLEGRWRMEAIECGHSDTHNSSTH